MNVFQNSAALQKLERFSIQTTGHVVAIAVAMFLIVAWILTGNPLFQWSERIARRRKLNLPEQIWGIMNKAIGLALLVAGIALIIYGANASDSVSSNVSRAFYRCSDE